MAALEEARRRGLIGDAPLDGQLVHALGFAEAVEAALAVPLNDSFLGGWVDLGSGGGLPGLVLAERWRHATGTLVDASSRSGRFLTEAVATCGLGDRVRVATARAEDVGRDHEYRATFDVAVARSFGPPALVAECAAPLLRVGGLLVVSEPPQDHCADPGAEDGDSSRWPGGPLSLLGLEPEGVWRARYGYQVLRQTSLCSYRFPRRVGVPRKRPLY